MINEVAPPGFGHTKSGKGDKKGGTAAAFDRARKRGDFKGTKSQMFAIMWSQKNKGDKPHYKPGTDKKYKKYQTESKSGTMKKLAKASALDSSENPKDQDRARAMRVAADFKSWRSQKRKGKVSEVVGSGILKKEEVVLEKDLNAAERRALPDKEFALPGKGKGPEGKQAGSYPIPDKTHARMALAMVAKHGTSEKKAKVRAAVAKKFPGIQQEDYETKKKGEVLKALDKKKFVKKYGKEKAPDIMYAVAAKTAKKKGDTSKSDDRYAYEEVQQEAIERQAKDRKKLSQPHSVSGSRRDHSHDVDSALTDYVPRKGKGRMRPASKKEMRVSAMREDKAFDNVVGKLRKKYGKDAVLTKDSPKPKAKPLNAKQIWKRDDENAVQREIDARYGGAANRKAGRGLGT